MSSTESWSLTRIPSRLLSLFSVVVGNLLAASAHARRRGGGDSGGEDSFPWLTEVVVYVLLGMLALSVVGALWRYLTRPSAADLARKRSDRRLASRDRAGRRPQR